MPLLDAEQIYKPRKYEWAYEAWLIQQQIHWIPQEVPMADDVSDWKYHLTSAEKILLTQIFRFFTQSDIEVGNCYMNHYLTLFKPVEIKMMLASFLNMETIHVDAYSHLMDTINMPDTEYSAFYEYIEMKNKYDYMHTFNINSKRDIAKTLAAYGAFTEGLQLFASFAMLLNFPRHGKMKGMGQIITWSVRDETLHTNSIIKLFLTFIEENPEIYDNTLIQEITQICKDIVEHEDKFIDLAFDAGGDIEGMTARDIKMYVRFIADRRMRQLKLSPIYKIDKNPLSWIDDILNAPEHVNFFENRATEYSKGATQGNWDNVF